MIDWKNISLKDLAGHLSKVLKKEGIDLILIGGACATIYSKNRYQSYDLDFITYEDMSKVKRVLKECGFEEQDKYFKHKECPWFVEFVSPPVAIGSEPIHNFSKVKTKMGTIKMLQPIDSVKDRLASYYHWNDRQGLEQAVNICCDVEGIDFGQLKKWSKNEGYEDKFNEFSKMLKGKK